MLSFASPPHTRNQIIHDYVLPCVLLEDLHQVYSIRTYIIALEHVRNQFRAASNCIEPSDKVVFSKAFLSSIDGDAPEAFKIEHFCVEREYLAETHPHDLVF